MDRLTDYIQDVVDDTKVRKYQDLIDNGQYFVDNELLADAVINDPMAWYEIIKTLEDL